MPSTRAARLALFIASLAPAVAACLPSPRVHQRAVEEIARGYQYLSRDDLERAEIAFAHALEFNRDIPEALNGAGVVERRRGRLAEAARLFTRAVEASPDFAEGYVNLGELELAQGHTEAAEDRFREALRIDPDLLVARLDLARALLHRGRGEMVQREALWGAARREYLHLLEATPDLPEAHHDLGFMDYQSGRYDRAAEEYGRAAELAPDAVDALHGSCIALGRLGRCAEAVSACQRCLKLDPSAEPCATSLRALSGCVPER